MTEVIAPLDARGRMLRTLEDGRPAPLEREDVRAGKRRGKKTGNVNMRDAEGQRTGYFRRDAEEASSASASSSSSSSSSSLSSSSARQAVADMVREEREGGARGMDEAYARNVLRKGKRFKADSHSRAGFDEEEEVDVSMYEAKKDKVTAQRRQEMEKAEAVRAHTTFTKAQQSCRLCFSSPACAAKHLIVALGEHTYLALESPSKSLTQGHCRIVPNKHINAGTAAGEEVWAEINLFKKSLERLAEKDGQSML